MLPYLLFIVAARQMTPPPDGELIDAGSNLPLISNVVSLAPGIDRPTGMTLTVSQHAQVASQHIVVRGLGYGLARICQEYCENLMSSRGFKMKAMSI